jgi:hypothetical protein
MIVKFELKNPHIVGREEITQPELGRQEPFRAFFISPKRRTDINHEVVRRSTGRIVLQIRHGN